MAELSTSDKRFRAFCFVIYPDSESYDYSNVLRLCRVKGKRVYYILHDRDWDENGQIKKPHYHVVLILGNACTFSALSKFLGIESNYIENCKSECGAVRYLIHLDDMDKFQYDISDIVCNDVERMMGFVRNEYKPTESERIEILFNEVIKGTTLPRLLRFALDNDCYSEFRRSYSIFKDLIYYYNPNQ